MSARRRLSAMRAATAPAPAQDGVAVPAVAGGDAEVDVAVVLDLLRAMCAAGSGVTGCLVAVGTAVGGPRGEVMCRAGRALVLGAAWDDAWDGAPASLEPVSRALRSSWEDGSAPGGALLSAAQGLRRQRHTEAVEAAARLGVRLVVPMGLCYLPAFVLVGLAPVLLSMATGALGS